MSSPNPARPFCILIAALGGEGGGVLSEWIVAAAHAQGYPVQSTSIPGVAQRTGATTYYVELWPFAEPPGARPLMTLAPSPGQVDALLASELLEAGRALLGGFVTPERTTLIASVHRMYTVAEKMQMGDGRFDPARLRAAAEALARRAILVDMQKLAQASGSVINAVLFGALAGSGACPLARAACEQAISAAGKGTKASLAGFALGFDHAAGLATLPGAVAPGVSMPATPLPDFPAELHELLARGLDRVREFQSARYAEHYLARLRPIAYADSAASGYALTRETARLLALWMSYDDVIRVADLKTRASRLAKVRDEVRAQPHEPVHIIEYFKPRLEEFTAILPAPLARAVRRLASRSALLRKLNPALNIRTSGILGFVMLRLLASLRPLRPWTVRFAEEQALIDRWLAAIERAARTDAAAALEIARCGRLIKGYGDTNARGKASFLRIFETLVEADGASGGALERAVREAREAALADPEGRTLEGALAARGITPLPPRAKPLVFVRRPTEQKAV
jgi:indolepyruvate ferredoxin oxidoreductase beta subunit